MMPRKLRLNQLKKEAPPPPKRPGLPGSQQRVQERRHWRQLRLPGLGRVLGGLGRRRQRCLRGLLRRIQEQRQLRQGQWLGR